MEVASAIQHGRTSANKPAAESNSNARHQFTHPEHSLAPTFLCSSNDTNADLGEMEAQTGPESSKLCQVGVPVVPTVDNRQANPVLPNRGPTYPVPVNDDQRAPQDPLFHTPLPSPGPDPTRNSINEETTMREPRSQASQAPPDTQSAIPSRVSQTPGPQRWSWVNARDKQKRKRAKNRIQLTKLCSVCWN